eukprot:2572054-Amphidinium_carterae.1
MAAGDADHGECASCLCEENGRQRRRRRRSRRRKLKCGAAGLVLSMSGQRSEQNAQLCFASKAGDEYCERPAGNLLEMGNGDPQHNFWLGHLLEYYLSNNLAFGVSKCK